MKSFNLLQINDVFFKGVEVGQGIHTKVAAVCAYKLGIPMETISVKYADNLTNPNSQATGGSITSEIVSQVIFRNFYEIFLF